MAERAFVTEAQSATKPPQLFFHLADDTWLQPAGVYATALVHAFGGGDHAGRMAGTFVGAINVGLIYFAARLLFGRELLALAAAALLLSMPAHGWYAREGSSAIYATPFVLTWAIGVLQFLSSGARVWLALAGLSLGLGMLTHPAAPLTMACLFVVTLFGSRFRRETFARDLGALLLPFAIVIALIALHFWLYPDIYADTFGRWAILKAHLRYPLDGLRAQINWNTLSNRATIFWGLLDPSFLLFAPENRRFAPLPIVFAALVPLGLMRVLDFAPPSHRVIVFSLCLVPPIVAATFGIAHDLSATVAMTAGIALIAAAGVEWLARRFGLFAA
ncbi:MAG TPA: glycosyltransferase family 39 protein [Vicinamibacterales bacterium]|nr:glycosyltransferase family 39 protein [Vicinamibacterales bacterium]